MLNVSSEQKLGTQLEITYVWSSETIKYMSLDE